MWIRSRSDFGWRVRGKEFELLRVRCRLFLPGSETAPGAIELLDRGDGY